jgi:amino-acid N-acetyltransferase
VAESPEGRASGFSEREFYLREFRGRTLAIIVSRAEFAEPLAPVLAELASAGARTIVIAREARILELLGSRPVLRASDPRLEGNVWRALHESPHIGIVVARAEDFGDHARELARKLGVFKLVWLDPDGGIRTKSGDRLAFVHRAELAELLAEPRRLQNTQRLRLWREIADMLDAGLQAINVCAPEGLGDELFTYAGSGTLFTRERYVTVRPLGVDDFDAAHDLLRRGVEEGFLAPRDEAEVDALLAAGFGAFVEGRDLAGLYTLTRFLGEGVGFSLVAFALTEAQQRELTYVFACTVSDRVGSFFERNGFRTVTPDELPADKWRDYDPERRERVLCYRCEVAEAPSSSSQGSSV